MTVKLSDLTSGSSNDAESGSDDDSDSGASEFEQLCEAISADFEHAMAYVDEHGSEATVIEFAEWVQDNPQTAHEVGERYRRWHDQHRIRQRWLHNVDGSFESWADQFYYGDGTNYNDVQEEARDTLPTGGLVLYKALFPEPQEEYWDGEPVLYHEFDIGYGDGKQDAHIYVEQSFVEEYGDFTMEVDGETKPRPPTDEELAAGSSSGSSTRDADETTDAPEDDGDGQFPCRNEGCDRTFDSKQGRAPHENRWCPYNEDSDRPTPEEAQEAHESRKQEASDDSDDAPSPAAEAGRIIAEYDLDAHPESVMGMLKGGMGEDSIVALIRGD